MGCRCIKSNQIEDVIIDLPECNIIEPPKENNSVLVQEKNEYNLKCINRITSSNTNQNWENQYNTQSYILDQTETRGKSYSKSIIICNTINTMMISAFSSDMVREINLVRLNPVNYTKKIREFMKFIKTDLNTQKKYFLLNKTTKINLSKGEDAFKECLYYISELGKKIKEEGLILNELELKDDLKLPFPIDNPEKCLDKEYIKENILNLKNKLDGNYRLKGFHYDLSTNDPEISTILQIVDDNNSCGKRRSMLLDQNVKYIGINIGKLKDNLYCIYLIFAG